jgi:hypothetical protein
MNRLRIVIPVLFLLYLCQHLIPTVYSQELSILTPFIIRTSFAFDPDANSGPNKSPRGSTTIRQTRDSRWVIYDRGDKTDWLEVSPPETKNKQLIIRFNFLRVVGTVIVEVYGADLSADVLEKHKIEKIGLYEYMTQSIRKHYVKVYAADQGNLAQYEFSYALAALPRVTSNVTSTNFPPPTVLPTITLTLLPIPKEVHMMAPTPTPTPTPTPMMVPTAIQIPTTTLILSKSDFQIIGNRYGVPSNLLLALSIIETQGGRVLGDYEVRKIVNEKQLHFLNKIARDTGRSTADFKGSFAGAIGYMQLMPATFHAYAQDGNEDGIKDPLNPYDSLATAAYFLARKIVKKNSIAVALRGYNNDPDFSEKTLMLYWKFEVEEKLASQYIYRKRPYWCSSD